MDQEKAEHLSDRSWQITRRWHQYEGEIRTAVLRVVLVSAFYTIQLIHFFAFSEGNAVDQRFHRQATVIAAIWLFVSLAVLVSLRQRFFPPALKYVTCAFDTALVTVCAALGAGPASPLVGCYYLVITAAALRISLPLIWQATLTSMAGYVALVGMADSIWFDAEHVTPLVQQLITLLALAGTGVVTGQLVRMIAASAKEYFERYQHLAELGSSHE